MVIDVGLKRLIVIALLATVGLVPFLIIYRETSKAWMPIVAAQVDVWALVVQLAWTIVAIWVMFGSYVPEKWRVNGPYLFRRL